MSINTAATDIVQGNSFVGYVMTGATSGTTAPIAFITDFSVNRAMQTRDTSNKLDGPSGSRTSGNKTWTASAKGNLSFTNKYYSYASLVNAYNAGSQVTVFWGLKTSETNPTLDLTKRVEGGTAFITGLNLSAPNEGNATYDISFDGDGDIKVYKA